MCFVDLVCLRYALVWERIAYNRDCNTAEVPLSRESARLFHYRHLKHN